MDARKAIYVFVHDAMPAGWTHTLPTDPGHDLIGNSFTRDSRLRWAGYPVKLTINQARLAQTNRIVPVDAHRVYNYTRRRYGWDNEISRTKQGPHANPSEEFVIGDIKLLHRYITHIDYVEFGGHERGAALIDIIRAYAEKWHLPYDIEPNVVNYVQEFFGYARDEAKNQIQKWFPNYVFDS